MYVHIDFGARAHEETSPRLRSAESTFIRRVGAQHASTTTGFDNKHCILTVGTVGRGPQTKEDQIVSKEKTVVLPEKDRRCCNYRTHTREYPWHKAHKREAHRLEYYFLISFVSRCVATPANIIPAIGDGVSLGKTEIDDFRARTTRQVK